MSTPEFWKLLDKYFIRFKTRVQFPYSLSQVRQEVRLLHLSRRDKLKLQASSLFLLVHTLYCFSGLCWCFKQRNTERQLSSELILLILLQFFLSACFIAIHFVLSFLSDVPPAILNAMALLETRVKSKCTSNFLKF